MVAEREYHKQVILRRLAENPEGLSAMELQYMPDGTRQTESRKRISELRKSGHEIKDKRVTKRVNGRVSTFKIYYMEGE